jgi:SAM-dependent methyltransferase
MNFSADFQITSLHSIKKIVAKPMKKTAPLYHMKEKVLKKYEQIGKSSLRQKETTGCCAPSGCSGEEYEVFADDYSQLQGYNEDADLGLGCGLPTEHAHIKPGDTVVDLGSGAGNDCFVARQVTGETGRVIGVDFSPSMVQKARENAAKLASKMWSLCREISRTCRLKIPLQMWW